MKYSMCGECPHKAKGMIPNIGMMHFCGHADGKDKWGTIGFIALDEEPPSGVPLLLLRRKKLYKSKVLGALDYVRDKISD